MRLLAAAAAACLVSAAARAALMDGPALANPGLPPQTFTAAEDGAVNPVFQFAVPGYGAPLVVSYGPYFLGQSASSLFSPPTSVTGAPSAPLALDDGPGATFDTSYQTTVESDGSNEVLGGLPAVATNGFGGPVAILFSAPVTGVTLVAGSFDEVDSTTIQAFTAAGLSLGTVTNVSTGDETFNLGDSGGASFSGLLITSVDPAGFAIDGIGVAAGPGPALIPAPGALAMLPSLLLLLRRKRR